MKKNLLLAAIVFAAVLVAPNFAGAAGCSGSLVPTPTINVSGNAAGTVGSAGNVSDGNSDTFYGVGESQHRGGSINAVVAYNFSDPANLQNVSFRREFRTSGSSSDSETQREKVIVWDNSGQRIVYERNAVAGGALGTKTVSGPFNGVTRVEFTFYAASSGGSSDRFTRIRIYDIAFACSNVVNHDYRDCYNNSAYWFDSNNSRNDLIENCGSGYCQNGQCYPYNLVVSCSASPNSILTNQSTNFISSVSGGAESYNYLWSGSCNGSNSNCSKSFSSQGTYTSTVTVTSGSQTSSANCSVNVNAPTLPCPSYPNQPSCPSQPPSPSPCPNNPTFATLSVSSTNVDVGDSITIYIDAQDQDGLLNVAAEYKGRWYSTDAARSVNTTKTWQVSESSPGTYRYCGRATGYKGNSRYSTETVDTSPSCIDVVVRSSCSQYCSGNTSCGYGVCSGNQRPRWFCSGNSCTYNCNYDSFCVPTCECTSGLCCDGCHYKSSYVSCNYDIQTEYSCPWGLGCGGDVGKRTRTRLQYCSGYDSQCSGVWGDWLSWTAWTITDACSVNEVCSPGASQCQYSSVCAPKPSYLKYFSKACYQDDIYWLDSLGVRQEKYKDCSDQNDCTIDSCKNGGCLNELKCDGSICAKESEDYCKSCNTCGDNSCGCQETADSCPEDCENEILVVAVLGKKEKDPIKWMKDIDMISNEQMDFLVVVKNKGDQVLKDVNVKVEMPEEIIYKGDLRLEGSTIPGDIREGVGIDSLDANGVKSLTFKGKIQSGKVAEGKEEVKGIATAGELSDTHTLAVNIKSSQTTAGFGLASISFLFQKWYFWVLAVLALLFLFFTVFRKFFSVTPV